MFDGDIFTMLNKIFRDNVIVYSNKFNVHDLPDSQIMEIQKLKENFFKGDFLDTAGESYNNLPYGFQGYIGGNSLAAGTKYWIVSRYNVTTDPDFPCNGGLTPFSRKLFSNDGMNWNGADQNTTWSRSAGIKMFLTN